MNNCIKNVILYYAKSFQKWKCITFIQLYLIWYETHLLHFHPMSTFVNCSSILLLDASNELNLEQRD